jgi:hypothetical protein
MARVTGIEGFFFRAREPEAQRGVDRARPRRRLTFMPGRGAPRLEDAAPLPTGTPRGGRPARGQRARRTTSTRSQPFR